MDAAAIKKTRRNIRRQRLQKTHEFIVSRAAGVEQVASELHSGNVGRARRDLRLLADRGLIKLEDALYSSIAGTDFASAFPAEPARALAARRRTRKTTNNHPKKEANMATQTTKSGVRKRGTAKSKTAAKAETKAKTNGGRKAAEVPAKTIKQIKQLRSSGASWDDVMRETGVNAIKARKLLAQQDGPAITIKAKSGDALAKEIAKHRADGVAWYVLAAATGKSEAEVKRLAEQGGASAEGRVYRKSEEKPKAKAAGKPSGKKSAGQKVRGSGAAGRRIAAGRRSRKADPSPQA